MTLEDVVKRALTKGDVERALLIAGGATTKRQYTEYERKLDQVSQRFRAYATQHAVGVKGLELIERAKLLHDFLWSGHQSRYVREQPDLPTVIDAHLAQRPEGNCLGLTSLYTVLALRENIPVALVSNNDHCGTIVEIDGISIPVENTSPTGFGKKIDESTREPLTALVNAAVHAYQYSIGEDLDLWWTRGEYGRAISLLKQGLRRALTKDVVEEYSTLLVKAYAITGSVRQAEKTIMRYGVKELCFVEKELADLLDTVIHRPRKKNVDHLRFFVERGTIDREVHPAVVGELVSIARGCDIPVSEDIASSWLTRCLTNHATQASEVTAVAQRIGCDKDKGLQSSIVDDVGKIALGVAHKLVLSTVASVRRQYVQDIVDHLNGVRDVLSTEAYADLGRIALKPMYRESVWGNLDIYLDTARVFREAKITDAALQQELKTSLIRFYTNNANFLSGGNIYRTLRDCPEEFFEALRQFGLSSDEKRTIAVKFLNRSKYDLPPGRNYILDTLRPLLSGADTAQYADQFRIDAEENA